MKQVKGLALTPQCGAKGFTLIELLIVIAILAILATVVLLVINPVQMFAQARDSQRIYDLNTLSNATALYITTVTSPALQAGTFVCGTNFGATVAGVDDDHFLGAVYTQYANVSTLVTGAGWVPVAYTGISGGSPLSSLPKDPTNTVASGYYYTYACDNTNKWFEFDANMESVRYANGGTDDIESTDGGDTATVYEVGNDPGLDL